MCVLLYRENFKTLPLWKISDKGGNAEFCEQLLFKLATTDQKSYRKQDWKGL